MFKDSFKEFFLKKKDQELFKELVKELCQGTEFSLLKELFLEKKTT